MNKNFIATAAIFGALSVALGAFAAHKLRDMLPADGVSTFETGVRYQFYHTFALLLVGILAEKFPGKWMTRAGNCFITGIILFSGSLYALTILRIAEATGANRFVGIITPFGGLFFIAGWLLFFVSVSKKHD
ncbi:MAG: DUF423 domain-containing protein [Bacteroidetes bacterium]|nr:DUF423 domain-containing protein [Bacteroidota bacterium]